MKKIWLIIGIGLIFATIIGGVSATFYYGVADLPVEEKSQYISHVIEDFIYE